MYEFISGIRSEDMCLWVSRVDQDRVIPDILFRENINKCLLREGDSSNLEKLDN